MDDPTSPKLSWSASLLGLRGQNWVQQTDEPRAIEMLNIEAVQHQSTFVREMLSETRLPARAVRPDKDKVSRSRALAARYEAGKVFHLRNAPGLQELEREMMGFPNSEHDDLVDALVYAADVGSVSLYFTSARRF
jgi:predicted phage terminase large subunit-like protein